MSQSKIMYIELKSGYADNGPAWIGRVAFSQSGRTVYFNGKALKRSGGMGASGNHSDLETGDEYWVSGVKKNGCDRHWAGSGKIRVQADVVGEYLETVGLESLDTSRYEIVTDIVETDIARMHKLENQPCN